MEDGDVRGAIRLVSSTEPVRRADEEALKLFTVEAPSLLPRLAFSTL